MQTDKTWYTLAEYKELPPDEKDSPSNCWDTDEWESCMEDCEKLFPHSSTSCDNFDTIRIKLSPKDTEFTKNTLTAFTKLVNSLKPDEMTITHFNGSESILDLWWD